MGKGITDTVINLEKKVDRIFELMEEKELSTFDVLDGEKVSEITVGELTPSLQKQIPNFNEYKN